MTSISSDVVSESVASPPQTVGGDRISKQAGANASQEAMAEPELLALIVEMRLGANQKLSTKEKPGSGSVETNSSAIDTMDLCHRKIHKLPEEMVDVIKDDVVRLALGYNFITTLPTTFVDLSKLRYLNIRANLISTFPEVLCSLPSLEILDMSRNKVRKLPEEPGRLIDLRVLSIANNRIRRLPEWLTAARHLRIFKIEGNPINWPPPHVSVMPAFDKASVVDSSVPLGTNSNASDDHNGTAKEKSPIARKKAEDRHMLVWLAQLRSWIAENRETEVAEKGERSEKKASSKDVTGSIAIVETTASDGQRISAEEGRGEGEKGGERQADDDVLALAVSKPSEGVHKQLTEDSLPNVQAITDNDKPLSASPETLVSKVQDMDTHNVGLAMLDREASPPSIEGDDVSANATIEAKKYVGVHQRNDSLDHGAISKRGKVVKQGLRSKKSLPDMRGGDVDFEQMRDHSDNSSQVTDATPRRKPVPIITDGNLGKSNIELEMDVADSPGAVENERNSYFKRLSTLPASSISTHVSISVLLCIDATRGILYALSQMHTAFRQYVAFATDERLTSQLSRVLGIAGNSMANLINALDRFDSQSRTKSQTMDPRTIRGVISATMESIHTFRKLVHVVQVQLKSLQTGADIRYTRTLLLLLYGSLAEIASSWSSVEPLLADIAPYMLMGVTTNMSAKDLGISTSSSSFAHKTLPSIAEAITPITPSSRTRMVIPPARPQRRRHAGSFSANDVVQGGTMTSTMESFARSVGAEIKEEEGVERNLHHPSTTDKAHDGKLDETSAILDQAVDIDRFKSSSGSEVEGRRTLSSSSSQFAQAHRSTMRNELLVDDHLVLLVVKITSIAFSVWVGIQDHLVALGLPTSNSNTQNMKTVGAASVSLPSHDEQDTSIVADFASSSMPKTPSRNGRAARQGLSEASGIGYTTTPNTPGHNLTASRSLGGGEGTVIHSTPQSITSAGGRDGPSSAPSPAFQRRLRQLHDLNRGVEEHTHRLYACLERAQEASGQGPTPLSPPTGMSGNPIAPRHARSTSTVSSNANSNTNNGSIEAARGERSAPSTTTKESGSSSTGEVSSDATLHNTERGAVGGRDLFSESGHFIKSVLHISHFIKSLAAEGFSLPKTVKASLAELTTCARDLTLHLHFLSAPTSKPMMAVSSHINALPMTASALSTNRTTSSDEAQQSFPASAPAY